MATAAEPGDVVIGRDETANFYQRPDGSTYAEFHTRAVNFADDLGDWQPINSAIVSDGSGWRNAANSFQVRFASDSTSSALVTLIRDGSRVEVGLVGAQPVTPVVAGSTITYPGILPGSDLSFTILSHGVVKSINLATPPLVAPTFLFSMRVDGLTLRQDADGPTLVNSGNAGWRMGKPWMIDASVPSPEFSSDVAMSILPAGIDEYAVSLVPDLTWLQSQARAYPVTVDPSFTVYPAPGGGDAYLDTFTQNGGYASTSQQDNADLRTGTPDGGTTRARSFLKFAVHDFIDAEITSASVQAYNYSSGVCSARTDLIKISSTWPWNITWSYSPQPSLTPILATTNSSPGCSGGGGWITLSSASLASLVGSWADDASVNFGVALFGYDDGSKGNTWKLFRSADFSDGARHPKLIVNYETGKPDIDSTTHPDQDTWYSGDDPAFSWSLSDPAGITDYSYVLDHAELTLPDTVSEGANTEKTYTDVQEGIWWFHVRAKNGAGTWSPTAGHYKIKIDTGPAAPTVWSPTHPDEQTWYANDDPSFDWLATDLSGIIGYSYELDQVEDTILDEISEGPGTHADYTDKDDGIWYFHVKARNGAGAWGATAHFQVNIDDTGATKPAVWSTTHLDQQTWYANDDPSIDWLATDVSGITGYSHDFDQIGDTIPDAVSEGSGTHADYTDKDDGIWYFHVKAQNGAGIWSETAHFTVNIDDGKPTAPIVATSSHAQHVSSSDRTVDVSWAPATDQLSGVTGYSWVFNSDENVAAGADPDGDSSTTGTTSAVLQDGTWWFHVRAIDAAGNVSDDTPYGPVVIDGTGPAAPIVTSTTHSQDGWSSSRTANFAWIPPTDGSVIAGYSVSFSSTPATEPDTTVAATAPTWTQSDIANGEWYFRVRAKDVAGNWGDPSIFYRIRVDGTVPAAPTITSSTHPEQDVWFSNNAPAFTVTVAPIPTSGIVAYEYAFDHNASAPITPPVGNSDSPSPSYPNSADGVWYLHARAKSGSNLWSSFATYTVRVDITAPTEPGSVSSPSHNTVDPTNRRLITTDWSSVPGADAASGVAGYSTAFNNAATEAPTGPVNVTGTTTTSTSRADGVWYFHVVTVDWAGNRSPDLVFGPVTIAADAPPVAESWVQDFIGLWQPRVESTTFGPTYVYADEYSPEILAEGFHSMDAEQKNYLIDRLNAVVYEPPVGNSAEENQAFRDTLYDFVFDKDTLRDIRNLTDWVAEAAPILGPLEDQTPAGVHDLAATQVPTLPAAIPGPTLPDAILAPLTSGMVALPDLSVARPVRDLASDTRAIIDNLSVPATDPRAAVQANLDSVAIETGFGPSAAPVFPDLQNLTLPAATYAICWQSAAQPQTTCRSAPGNVLLPAPVNVPTSVDVTGDGVDDVQVTFGPVVDSAYPTGQSGQLVISKLGGEALQSHVWIVYDFPLFPKRVLVGFDGYDRGAALSQSTTATFTIKNAINAQNGDVSSTYSLTQTSQPNAWALTFGTRDLDAESDNNTNPVDASLRFSPVPAAISGDVNFVRTIDDSTGATVRQLQIVSHVTAPPSGPAGTRTNLDGIVNQTNTGEEEIANTRAVVTGLPTNADITIRQDQGGATANQLKIAIDDDQSAVRVAAARVVTRAGATTKMYADVQSVPATAALTIIDKGDRGEATYSASGPVDKIALAKAEYTGDELSHGVSIAASDLPTAITANWGATMSGATGALQATYVGNSVVPNLDVAIYNGTNQLAAVANITGLPTQMNADLDFGAGRVDLIANAPLGSLSLKGSVSGHRLFVPTQEHATLITDATGASASVRISGFREARAVYGSGEVTVDTSASPGGQPFLIAGRSNQDTVSASLGQLPATAHVDISQSTLRAHYLASSGINTLTFYADKATSGPMLEGHLAGVPTEITVTGQLSDPAKVTYVGSGSMSSADFFYNSSPTAGDDSGTRIFGTVTGLPSAVTAVVDLPGKEIDITANQPVGHMTGVFARNGGDAHVPAIEHASFVKSTDDNGDHIGASVNVRGFTSAKAEFANNIMDGRLEASPGGQVFRIMGSVDGTVGYATFDGLPGSTHVNVDIPSRHAFYEGDPAAGQIVAYASMAGVGTLQLDAREVPTRIDVEVTPGAPEGPTMTYTSTGGSLGALTAVYSPQVLTGEPPTATGKFISMTAHDLPSAATAIVDLDAGHIDWNASSAVTDVAVRARNFPVDNTAGYAAVSDVPTHWLIDYTDSNTEIRGVTGPIGSAAFAFSNDGPPVLPSGNVLRFHGNATEGLFNFGARVTNLNRVSYSHSNTGWNLSGDADLEGAALGIDVDARFPADEDGEEDELTVYAAGTLSRFPATFSATHQNKVTTYTASSAIDVALDVAAGWTVALETIDPPAWYHGISVRDAACALSDGCRTSATTFCDQDPSPGECRGFKSRIQLWGLADSVTVDLTEEPNPSEPTIMPLRIQNLAPPAGHDYMQLYLDVRHFFDRPVLFIDQRGIPSPVSLNFGPFTVDGGPKVNKPLHVHAETHHSAPMGRLTLDVLEINQSGENGTVTITGGVARFEVSSVPATLVLDALFGEPSELKVGVSSPIGSVLAFAHGDFTYKPQGRPEQAMPDASAQLKLENVPTSLDADGKPQITVDISHPPTAAKPQADDPILTPCDGTPPNDDTPTGAGSGRGADGLPTVEFNAPASGVSLFAEINNAWVQISGSSVDLTLKNVKLGFEGLSKRTTFEPTQYAAGITIVSDSDDPFGVTEKIWVETDFDLKVPCQQIDKSFEEGAVRLTGKLDGTRVQAQDLQISLTDVGHATLTAGAAYLAYGVEGHYRSFDFRAPNLTATTHSQLTLAIKRGFGFGVLPEWFHQTVNLDSPDDPSDPDDFENGWHTLYAHELSDSLEPSKLSVCPQVAWVRLPCVGLATQPGLMGLRPNAAHFDGAPDDYVNDTKSVFTFIDPGTNPIFRALLEPVTAKWLAPPGYERRICLHVAGLNAPCWNG